MKALQRPGMILKTETKKCKPPLCQPEKQQLKQNHFDLRYEMKTTNKKKSQASSNRKG